MHFRRLSSSDIWQRLICVAATLLIILPKCSANTPQTLVDAAKCDGLFFASFNIQNFGVSKAGRSAVMDALASIIARYDIVAIQELSQKPSGDGVCGPHTMSAICSLLSQVRQTSSRDFSLAVSPRIGDEQYVMMFDAARVSLLGDSTYPDPNSKHSRPPHAFQLSIADAAGATETLAVAVTHTKPTEATQEITNFPEVVKWMEGDLRSDHTMIVGDFNADGSYFDEDSEFQSVMKQLPGYSLLTGNELDTTVAASSNTYDRIIASDSISADAASVFVIENHIDLNPVLQQGCADDYVPSSVCTSSITDWVEITKELSDHYPVEICLRIAAGTSSEPQQQSPATASPPGVVSSGASSAFHDRASAIAVIAVLCGLVFQAASSNML